MSVLGLPELTMLVPFLAFNTSTKPSVTKPPIRKGVGGTRALAHSISAELWKHAIASFECPGDKTQIHTWDLDICFHLR